MITARKSLDRDFFNHGWMQLAASVEERENSATAHQAADLNASLLGPDKQPCHRMSIGCIAWFHLIESAAHVNMTSLWAGDVARSGLNAASLSPPTRIQNCSCSTWPREVENPLSKSNA